MSGFGPVFKTMIFFFFCNKEQPSLYRGSTTLREFPHSELALLTSREVWMEQSAIGRNDIAYKNNWKKVLLPWYICVVTAKDDKFHKLVRVELVNHAISYGLNISRRHSPKKGQSWTYSFEWFPDGNVLSNERKYIIHKPELQVKGVAVKITE